VTKIGFSWKFFRGFPWASETFHFLMSFIVLAEFAAHIYGKIHWTVDFLPVIFIAVVLVTAGVG